MIATLTLAWIFMHSSHLLLVLMIHWYKGLLKEVIFPLIKVQGFFLKDRKKWGYVQMHSDITF